MQVHLRHDDHVQGSEALAGWAEQELTDKLTRFRDHVTRVDVHLSDASATRKGETDMRCTMDARCAGRPPVVTHHDAAQVGDAFRGASDKLLRALDTALGRERDAHGRDSIRGHLEG